jgi:2-polyprenyl-3-methyl-5-hydroxy-6-metoxy-1,4-benzoquinol methylase
MKIADYGIDKPERVRGLGMVGLVLIGTGLAAFIGLQGSVEDWPELILTICLWLGVLCWIGAGIMLWSSKSGKIILATRMVNELRWMGREKVLDVGCGRGLLTILCARKAPQGEIIGIDTWSSEHLTDNTIEGARENAATERVDHLVRFEDGDATDLRYGHNSFDKIVSSLCLHAIGSRPIRNKAVTHLVKMVRPGGEIAILDILHTREYMKIFQQQGLKNIRRSKMTMLYCLPTRYVIGEKKLAGE